MSAIGSRGAERTTVFSGASRSCRRDWPNRPCGPHRCDWPDRFHRPGRFHWSHRRCGSGWRHWPHRGNWSCWSGRTKWHNRTAGSHRCGRCRRNCRDHCHTLYQYGRAGSGGIRGGCRWRTQPCPGFYHSERCHRCGGRSRTTGSHRRCREHRSDWRNRGYGPGRAHRSHRCDWPHRSHGPTGPCGCSWRAGD